MNNKLLHDALRSQIYVSDKRLRIDIGALKEMLHKREIDNIHWVERECQLADSLIYGKLYDPE